MSMRLFIGGMRGSRPATGSGFEEFGGDTTSLLLIGSHEERLVLDAGTGMRAVAEQLAQTEPGKVTVLFSHYHLDHMVGLAMNPLFYRPDWSFTLTGPTFADGGVRDAVTRLLAPPYWPVSWERMNASLQFAGWAPTHAVLPTPDGLKPILILRQNLHVRGCSMPHPGGCVAYRIDDTGCGKSVIFATDLEWRKRTPADETAFRTLCAAPEPADMLIIDAHFGRAQQEAFVGWGHTSWEDGLEIAESTGIRRVLLGHHAPEADDQALSVLEQQVKNVSPGAALARAGQWITMEGRR
jgi:ribonuclease BN (tRNA processing enzyme)